MNLLDADRDLGRDSYYAATSARGAPFGRLDGSADCDVAIVGGGLAGLSAAIELAERGFQVRVLEAHQVGWGASGRNGGQLIAGLACDPRVIERQLGLDDARRVWAATLEAIDIVHARCARFGIDAEWQAGHLTAAVNARRGQALDELADRLGTRYGYPLQRIGPGEIGRWIDSARFHAALHDPRGGHLHPLKYVRGLAQGAASLGVTIHEDTRVSALLPGARTRLVTPQGTLRAGRVLLAGNAYLQGLSGRLEARILPIDSFIVATEPLPAGLAASLIPSGSAVSDNNFMLDYFRVSRDRRLLFGGGEGLSGATPARRAAAMRERLLRVFPQLAQAALAHLWGGPVDVTMNRAPDFGRLGLAGSPAAQVYYLQGFSGHGLALTGLAGRLVAEAMAGDASRFDLFARLRHRAFAGGRLLRAPTVWLGLAIHRLRDALAC